MLLLNILFPMLFNIGFMFLQCLLVENIICVLLKMFMAYGTYSPFHHFSTPQKSLNNKIIQHLIELIFIKNDK